MQYEILNIASLIDSIINRIIYGFVNENGKRKLWRIFFFRRKGKGTQVVIGDKEILIPVLLVNICSRNFYIVYIRVALYKLPQ